MKRNQSITYKKDLCHIDWLSSAENQTEMLLAPKPKIDDAENAGP